MDLAEIAGIIIALGVIGGVMVTINKSKHKNINAPKDSNEKNKVKQKAKSGGDTYQSGRDINVRK